MKKDKKNFLNKFCSFTNAKFKLLIRWKTRNLKSIFPLKDKDFAIFIKGFVLVNQYMSVKQNGMWR